MLKDGQPEDVRSQTLERLALLSKGGGFVFNTVHNIMPDVPARNVIAMFDAVEEFNGSRREP